jgi:hypothetical protein
VSVLELALQVPVLPLVFQPGLPVQAPELQVPVPQVPARLVLVVVLPEPAQVLQEQVRELQAPVPQVPARQVLVQVLREPVQGLQEQVLAPQVPARQVLVVVLPEPAQELPVQVSQVHPPQSLTTHQPQRAWIWPLVAEPRVPAPQELEPVLPLREQARVSPEPVPVPQALLQGQELAPPVLLAEALPLPAPRPRGPEPVLAPS